MPGGLWVNLGPLLYHYSDVPFEFSIEPSLEDLLEIIQQIGFVIKVIIIPVLDIIDCLVILNTNLVDN